MVQDLRSVLRVAQGRQTQTSAVVLNGRMLYSGCERGPRQATMATRANGQARCIGPSIRSGIGWRSMLRRPMSKRAQVQVLAQEVQLVSGQSVKLAFADQGYTGKEPAQAAQDEGIEVQVIKLPEAKKGFILLPRRWVVERSLGWLNRFRRLARDDERLPETLVGLHFVVFAMLMLVHAAPILQSA
ncbi:Transposase (plasmid) [Mycetohabitans rhizoxinica HKI 454]|uniref:Transposase n=1 Tax=Mycetohabitans rhizoxinica (strain DSM 19002 / CIP 109453 / HKI 454) TaxID=882378 RepID=E5AWC3_MYCRK|nr:Transposase [Mycetohabitans rhizoxinica HKI 454]